MPTVAMPEFLLIALIVVVFACVVGITGLTLRTVRLEKKVAELAAKPTTITHVTQMLDIAGKYPNQIREAVRDIQRTSRTA